MPTLGISTWSVRHLLGPCYYGLDLAPDKRRRDDTFGAGALALLDLPAALRDHGYTDLDICHFHLPRADDAYLAELRARFATAGTRPLTLLVDEGDIGAADAAARERDMMLIRAWIDVAARLGARYVRVIAGETDAGPGDDAIQRSADALSALAAYARDRSVGVITENWRALAATPENVRAVLAATGDAVGLCADFGNYTGAGKYDALRMILPCAVTVHAKAEFAADGAMGEADFRRCLALAQEAGFDGPYILIFSGPGDEWAGIAREAAVVNDAARRGTALATYDTVAQ